MSSLPAVPRILIVDESARDRQRAVEAVRLLGHDTLVATDGDTALALCRRRRPDLVLMDVVLRGEVDGFAATRRLQQDPELREIPVVMVTSRNQESDVFWARRQGAVGYVVKPYRPEELASVIRHVLEDRGALQ